MEKQPISQYEWIGPITAQAYLSRNTKNRRLKENIVAVYTRCMKAGKWTLSSDAIAFDIDGDLINGQHRLHAVVKSGTTQQFLVTRNFPVNASPNIDNGATRTAGDVLCMEKVQDSTKIAAILRRFYALQVSRVIGNHMGSESRWANTEILDKYMEDPAFWSNLTRMARRLYDTGRFISITEYGSYTAYLVKINSYPLDTVESFFKQVAGCETPTNSVTSLLRTALINDKLSKYRMTAMKRQKLIIKAWNCWITGKTVKVLLWDSVREKDLWFA